MTAGQAAFAAGVCVIVAVGLVVYAASTLDAPVVEPAQRRFEGAWLTPEELDDADRQMMIDEAGAREDATVARLDAIIVPGGDWDIPKAWHDRWKAQG